MVRRVLRGRWGVSLELLLRLLGVLQHRLLGRPLRDHDHGMAWLTPRLWRRRRLSVRIVLLLRGEIGAG